MSAGKGSLLRTYLGYGVLALLFAIAVTTQYRDARERFALFYDVQHPRPPFDAPVASNRIEGVEPEAESAGIKAGDYLVSVNGEPFEGSSDLFVPLRGAKTGDVMAVGTRSTPFGPPEKEVNVVLAPALFGGRTTNNWLPTATATFGVPIACIALGFFVVVVRIRDPLAWMLLMLMLGFSSLGGGSSAAFFGYDDLLQPFSIVYLATVQIAWPIGMMLFGIYFGGQLAFDRRYPWAKWLLLAPLLLFDALFVVATLLTAHDWSAADRMAGAWFRVFDQAGFFLLLAGVSVFFAGTGYKAFTAPEPDARRRLKLLHAGATVSLTPLLIVVLRAVITGNDAFDSVPAWLAAIILGLLFLFPVTFAYVIVVQKAMDVRVMIRQGIQYLLASGSVRALQIVLSLAVVFGAALLATEEVNRPQRIGMIAVGLACVAAIQGAGGKLRGWVDRRFFREAYNAEQILSDLADKVRTFVETGPLLETVATRISESLHVPRVALLVRSGPAFQPAYALGYAESPRFQIPEQSGTADYLRREGHARVYPEDDSSWIYRPEWRSGSA